jgi:hypothetical protein
VAARPYAGRAVVPCILEGSAVCLLIRQAGQDNHRLTVDPVDRGGDLVGIGELKAVDGPRDLLEVAAELGDNEDRAYLLCWDRSRTRSERYARVGPWVDDVIEIGHFAVGVRRHREVQLRTLGLLDVALPARVAVERVNRKRECLYLAAVRRVSELGPSCNKEFDALLTQARAVTDVAVSRGGVVHPWPFEDERGAEAEAVRLGAVMARRRRHAIGAFSLSPVSQMGLPAGTHVVLPSPNGSMLSFAAARTLNRVPVLAAACFRNAATVARAARSRAGKRRSG